MDVDVRVVVVLLAEDVVEWEVVDDSIVELLLVVSVVLDCVLELVVV